MALYATSTISFAQYAIRGFVKFNNENLPGAIVTINNSYLHQTSDVNGTFEFKNLKAGTYFLQTKLLGFKTKIDTVELNGDKSIDIGLESAAITMDEVQVTATRATETSAVAYSTLSKKEIEKQNLGADVPYMLNMLPSTVVNSDAGNGVGYTGIRIRGTDPTRINVTINGIPVNDAESQGTYWVDLPDLLSSTDNIQVQRGLGTSTNGSGAFGGSINIQTDKLNPTPYIETNNTYGSFNTSKNTLKVGSGLFAKYFTVDARLSNIRSDGFIDRAYSDMQSSYWAVGYYKNKTSIKAIALIGKEKTYQAWWGVPQTKLITPDSASFVRSPNTTEYNTLVDHYYNNKGFTYQTLEDSINLFASDNRKYNYYTYPDQTDNYWQNNYQLLLTHAFNRKLNINAALHCTNGKGYYQEYKLDQPLNAYNLDLVDTTNLVRQRWLDNDFYGTTWSLNYNPGINFSLTWGGAINQYVGYHFGKIVSAENIAIKNVEYYRNRARKQDANSFVKIAYVPVKNLVVYADVQGRFVGYHFLGFDATLLPRMQNTKNYFFNPKGGVTYTLKKNFKIYASYGIGNKEPNRDDHINSSPSSRPKHEQLKDFEMGISHELKKIRYAINMYDMTYVNQLVLTGEINDVGSYVRTNIAKSYRRGFEIEFGWMPFKNFEWAANATLSENKVIGFTEFIDDYVTYTQSKNTYTKTDIAFAPSTIIANQFLYTIRKGLSITLLTKYVGEQYLDNTSNRDRMLDAFFVNDLRINYTYKPKSHFKEVGFILAVNNFLNEKYEPNGYTFSYLLAGQPVTENYYYPQAGINLMAGISLKF